jgi:hypothetical protein
VAALSRRIACKIYLQMIERFSMRFVLFSLPYVLLTIRNLVPQKAEGAER